jgi:hypothetical protein
MEENAVPAQFFKENAPWTMEDDAVAVGGDHSSSFLVLMKVFFLFCFQPQSRKVPHGRRFAQPRWLFLIFFFFFFSRKERFTCAMSPHANASTDFLVYFNFLSF